MADPTVREITDRLAEPFDPADLKLKPKMVKNNKALALVYVDVRVVEDRLDEVLGPENWQDDYQILNDGCVVCRLSLRLGDSWVVKVDVGNPSEQPDAGDRLKASFSDALKRAAIKFGLGRYLYRLPGQWMDYDPVEKRIKGRPNLPPFAVPGAKGGAARPSPPPQAQAAPPAATPPKPPPAASPPALPANGKELHQRLQDYDAKLAAEKLCGRGGLVSFVVANGVKAGYSANVTDWPDQAIRFAVELVKQFEADARRPKG